ncbi:MAG: Rne/Rng family ribonuclease [Bradyrhizobium sp.]
MPNKMLIDATHPEETRVVVVHGNRVEEFDFETAQRKQLRGNIYLAKVTRVEPSLQAAFVEYGGNRHGFLAFSEIHPDYYQIPVADRQALIEAEERAHREAEEESESRSSRRRSRHRNSRRRGHDERIQSDVIEGGEADQALAEETFEGHDNADHAQAASDFDPPQDDALHHDGDTEPHADDWSESGQDHDDRREDIEAATANAAVPATVDLTPSAAVEADAIETPEARGLDEHGDLVEARDNLAVDQESRAEQTGDERAATSAEEHAPLAESGEGHAEESHDDGDEAEEVEDELVESVGGEDVLEEVPERPFRPRRQYKIQEVIKRRQVMLVQVVKEERGNKGAALTSYLSLAGRYAVLMPNTARGGGISRKITSAQDRSRLKEVVAELDVPDGMGIILRTAGASRNTQEIKRDFEYLIRLWETVRDTTLQSQAPTLVYEEGSLIKRSLRDLYNREIDEILVAGEAGYREAHDFMKMLMPSQVRAVKLYRDRHPLFSRMGVESQLDAMFSPIVQLRSGGYIVINQTEALVSIDVNSGRATREHHIEDTALKTNLEAAEEVARQLRLRDLAGLIVIDFIDMDEKRNNRAVERKLSDCLRQDRARIQVGRISHFGLLEMSRQRIRASVLESSTEPCTQCGGTGHVRSVSSVALQLLRGLEEILMRGATHNLVVRTRTDVALYVLNHKRGHLRDLENSFKVTLSVIADPTVSGQQSFIIDRGEQMHTLEAAKALLTARTANTPPASAEPSDEDGSFDLEGESEIETEETEGLADDASAGETIDGEASQEGPRRKRRRRRRARGSGEAPEGAFQHEEQEDAPAKQSPTSRVRDDEGEVGEETEDQPSVAHAEQSSSERRPRRRGRRGGRRRRGGIDDGLAGSIADELAPPGTSEAADAVADFDSNPSSPILPEVQPERTAPASESQPVAEQQGDGATTPEQPEEPAKPAPRRSTVREKVTPLAEARLEPAREPESLSPTEPAPPAAEPGPEEAPRRAGWWSRRFGRE